MNNQPYELTESDKKWNKLWAISGTEELAVRNPRMNDLCDYYGGIMGEGHSGWLFNTESAEGKEALSARLASLKEILPEHLYANLEKAVRAYDTDDEDDVCAEADDYFYEHEQEVNDIFRRFADTLDI